MAETPKPAREPIAPLLQAAFEEQGRSEGLVDAMIGRIKGEDTPSEACAVPPGIGEYAARLHSGAEILTTKLSALSGLLG